MKNNILVVGTGLAGSVCARLLAEKKIIILLFCSRLDLYKYFNIQK